MKVRQCVGVVSGWLAGLLILHFIFQQVDIDDVLTSLRMTSVSLLAFAVLLTLMAHSLRVIKWYVVLRRYYDGPEVAVLFFSSKAFGGLSPARLGEFVPLLSGKYRSGRVAALLVADRFLEAYATLFFGAIGIFLLHFREAHIIAGGVVIFLALCVALVLLASTRSWQEVKGAFGRWPGLARGSPIVVAVSGGFGALKRLLWLLLLISMMATALDLFFFQILLLSVGVRVAWPLAATMVCVAAIAALIAFTPWGLGIVEAPMWWLGQLYHLPPAGLGAFYVLVRVIALSSIWLLYGLSLLVSSHRTSVGASKQL